jgi:nitroreductase
MHYGPLTMTDAPPGEQPLDVFEAMGTARAMRWFRPDPVPWALLERVLWAATRASSPNNVQAWDFVVVQDAEVRSRVGELFATLLPPTTPSPSPAPAPPEEDPTARRTSQGAMNLMAHFGEVPAVVFVCGADVYPPANPDISYMYSSVFAAAQNLIVAARAVGLGAAFTTFHRYVEAPLRELLAVPADRHISVTIPVGWPARPFGPLTRKPLELVVHHDGW